MLRGWALAIGVVVMMTAATASAEPVVRPIDATVAQAFQRRLLAAPGPPYAGRIAVLRDMLARYTADYGAAHPTTNSVRQSLASYLFADHQYAEAAPLLDAVLRQYEATSPPNPVLISEVLQVAAANAEALGRLKDAERAWRRMLDVDAARGAPTLAAFMGLITNLDRQSRGKEVIDLLKARLESERKAGGYLGDLALNLGNRLYQADGREREAEPILRLALAEAERVQGPTSRRVGDAATALGDDLAYLDNYRDAQALHRRALAIFEATDGQDSIAVARVSDRLGEALKDDRKLADAVVAYSRALDIYEARLGYKDDRTVSVATTLGAALMAVAKVADAEQRMGAAERASVQLNGEDHVRTARLRVVLAITRGTRGDTEGAVRLLQAALPILERDAGPKDDDTQVARLTLKAMLGKQGLNVRETKSAAAAPSTADEAAFQAFVKCNDDSEVPIKDLERTLAQLEKDRLPPLMLIGCQMKLGILYGADEQYQKSAAILAKADAGISQLLGPQAPERAPIVAARAAAAHELGRYAESASLFREGCDTLERIRADRSRAAGRSGELSVLKDIAISCGGARAANLWRLSRTRGAGDPDALKSEAFAAAQRGSASGAGDALARASALIAASRAGLGPVLERYEKALSLRDDLDQQVADKSLDPTAPLEARRAIAARRDAAQAEVTTLGARIRAEQPLYWDLRAPEPLALSDLQRPSGPSPLLGPDEALVLWMLSDDADRGLVFAVSREGSAWAEISMTTDEVEAKVRALRAQIDPGAYGVTAGEASAAEPQHAAFDRTAAYALYGALLGDPAVAAVIGPKSNLIIVPSGPLASLPPALLVTSPPIGGKAGDSDPAALRRTDWLVRHKAVSILPSVAALRTLRELLPRARAETPDPLLAFADPDFGGRDPKGAKLGRVRAIAAYYRDGRPAGDQLKALPPLPGTRVEGDALVRILHAPQSSLFTGAGASEAALRREAARGELARARVIAFSTHGLLAGDVTGLAEPALVLAAPRGAPDGTDGLLTASEAAALRLNADWVLLSACNTAAPDAPGADGLSGLARAFFHAGARSLLVSHWRLFDGPTAEIIETLFDLQRGGMTKAEALRRASVKLLDDPSADRGEISYAHPAVWAPFVLVGESR